MRIVSSRFRASFLPLLLTPFSAQFRLLALNMSMVTVNATGRHTATVIFLHGLGDTGHGWSSSLEVMKLPHVKFLCPTAPVQPVTLNMGFRMPSWFDIVSLDLTGAEDETGIKQGAEMLRKLIADEEKSGIPSSRIIVGGFSQGGALALYTALTNPKPLAGVLCLSTWLPLHQTFSSAPKGNLPIFQAHGNADPVVRFEYGRRTREALEKLTTNSVFKVYEGMGHSSSPQELTDVERWIKETLPQQD